ncbi:hypothetical protein MXU84_02655 [Klebsiella pneumoniae]|nr:hypothetical protein [Klebsiella pneumoniae]
MNVKKILAEMNKEAEVAHTDLTSAKSETADHYLTEIDGSCNEKTFGQIAESGVDVFIVGTSGLFSLHEDVSQAWDRMIEIFQRETVAA